MKRNSYIANQSKHPRGLFGWLLGTIMRHETIVENDRALELLSPVRGDSILEIGVGPGRLVGRIANTTPDIHVVGIDTSPAMVRMARRQNRCLISKGSAEIRTADAHALPFPENHFDRAVTVNTIYFWADLQTVFREIHRVLRPEGLFVVAFRYDAQAVSDFPSSVYTFRSPEEVTGPLQAVGFERPCITKRDDGQRRLFFAAATKQHAVVGQAESCRVPTATEDRSP